MEKQMTQNEPLWRVWVDTRRRIVSFHEEEGCQLLEFRSRAAGWCLIRNVPRMCWTRATKA